MQQGSSCLFLPPSYFLPGYYSLTDCLVSPSVTRVHAHELDSRLVGETTKAAQSCLLRMQPCAGAAEVHGTKELLSHTALMEQLAKNHHPHFVSISDTLLNSRVSPEPKTSGYAMLCDRIGLNEESCTPHL